MRRRNSVRRQNSVHRAQVRGTATIEGLMVVFTFLIVWAGVIYVGGLYQSKILAKTHARQCAWLIAERGCRAIPPECKSRKGGGGGSDKDDSVHKAGEASAAEDLGTAFQEVLMDQIRGLFADRVETTAVYSVEEPVVIGGGTVEVDGSFSLPCKPQEFRLDHLAKDIWRSFMAKRNDE